MCWGAYGPTADHNKHSTLWPDDVAGIQANYRKLFKGLKPPTYANKIDLYKPFDVNNPWPRDGGSEEIEEQFPDRLADEDGDGIPDDVDKCSNTPKGENVWKEGEWIGCSGGQQRDRNLEI